MKNILLFIVVISLTLSSNAQTVTDIDGNLYSTVTIGTQIWMAENLKTTKYKDGTPINDTGNTVWRGRFAPTDYCWFNNDSASYAQTYGALYSWSTVETGNLCPAGWHVPTHAEWTTLTEYLGGESVAGGKLKETGTTHWYSPNTGATNETGFTALPGGCLSGGTFGNIGYFGIWWSVTEGQGRVWTRYVSCYFSDIQRVLLENGSGFFSVRCLMDNSTSEYAIPILSEEVKIYMNTVNNILIVETGILTNPTMEICNINGSTMYMKILYSSPEQTDMSGFEPGVYLVKVRLEGVLYGIGLIVVR
jgi:uncharacterized protein (TIGR02145 family)